MRSKERVVGEVLGRARARGRTAAFIGSTCTGVMSDKVTKKECVHEVVVGSEITPW